MEARLKPDPFDWVVEPFLKEPSLIQKSMFGCLAYYLFGKLILVTTDDRPPWRGLLIPTEKAFHGSMKEEIPGLVTHPVLKKWLYLPKDTEEFERRARRIVTLILARDTRLGVEPAPRQGKRKRKSSSAKRLTST